jgi:hypothetical protein
MRYLASLLVAAGALSVAAVATASPAVVPPRTLTISVGTHGVAGGPRKFTVRKGTRVMLVVRSTIGEAVHLHGYDIEKKIVSKTRPVRMPFIAKVAGVFEIELHLTETRGLRIGQLTVR